MMISTCVGSLFGGEFPLGESLPGDFYIAEILRSEFYGRKPSLGISPRRKHPQAVNHFFVSHGAIFPPLVALPTVSCPSHGQLPFQRSLALLSIYSFVKHHEWSCKGTNEGGGIKYRASRDFNLAGEIPQQIEFKYGSWSLMDSRRSYKSSVRCLITLKNLSEDPRSMCHLR